MGLGEMIGYLLVAFASSALVGFLVTERRRAKRGISPEPGATLRLRTVSGMYRSKLVSVTPDAWSITAPLSRNNYVPLRVDDEISIEAPVADGVYVFRTVVLERDVETHEFRIRPPINVVPQDRREVVRCRRDEPASIDGAAARLVDVSPLGARLKCSQRFRPGDRVRVDLPQGMVFAWVLESWPTRLGEEFHETMRVRFETTIDGACS